MIVLSVREAEPADARAVARIVEAAYERWVPRLGRRPPPMDLDYAARIRAGRMLVAEGEGIVGAMAVVPEADQLLIESLIVAPGSQGQGVGKLLIARAEGLARERGLRRVWLVTHVKMTENQDIYRHLDFRECGREGSGEMVRVIFDKQVEDEKGGGSIARSQ